MISLFGALEFGNEINIRKFDLDFHLVFTMKAYMSKVTRHLEAVFSV